MNTAIANIIKSQIQGLSFIDRIGGAVRVVSRQEQGAKSTIIKKFPVDCGVTAEQTILDWDAARVKELKSTTTKTAFDDGYKKANSEVLAKFENDFKTKTGYKSDKKGLDLILEYAGSIQTKDGAITEDAIKKHPLYLSLQEEKETAVKDALTQGEEKLNQFQTEIKKKETFNSVAQKALEIFHSAKPVLSSDPIKAKKQEELFLRELKAFDYELQGERIVVLKEGKVYENQNGHPLKFDDLVKTTANDYFDFHAADKKQNAGNGGNQGDNKKTTFTFDVPKDAAEYAKAISDPNKSLEERQAIDAAFQASQKTN